MSLLFLPEIVAGILLTRLGEVHRDYGGRRTRCGQTYLPGRAVAVSHVQAVVHKLRLCPACYPAHNNPGGRSR